MKIARYKDETGVKLGAVKGDGVIDLTRRFPSLSDNAIELIQQWSEAKPDLEKIVSHSAPDAALANVRLLAPVARPGKIMAIGLNYADHIRETGQKMPSHQIWFTKAVTSINGPFDPIELPIVSAQVDYEAELVVIRQALQARSEGERSRCRIRLLRRQRRVGARLADADHAMGAGQVVRYARAHRPLDCYRGRDWRSPHDGHPMFRQWRAAPEFQYPEPRVQRVRSDCAPEPRRDAGTRRHNLYGNSRWRRACDAAAAVAQGRRQGACRNRSHRIHRG
jgi:hypothetical protein